MTKNDKKDCIEKLQDLIDIQSRNGVWDSDSYMQGLGNGLICAMSILTGKDSDYLFTKKQLKRKNHDGT